MFPEQKGSFSCCCFQVSTYDWRAVFKSHEPNRYFCSVGMFRLAWLSSALFFDLESLEPVCCLNSIWQAKMQHIKRSILTHVRIAPPKWSLVQKANARNQHLRQLCTTLSTSPDDITTRVLTVVKNFDRLDAAKVTETADFRKDLSLDSLDRVELVMAFEQEFSIDIPDDQADKLTCCADVAKYIESTTEKF